MLLINKYEMFCPMLEKDSRASAVIFKDYMNLTAKNSPYSSDHDDIFVFRNISTEIYAIMNIRLLSYWQCMATLSFI